MADNFKVVKIISDYEIVVNAGSDELISKGGKLEVFLPGEEVIDPDTNESLGKLDTIKAYLTVKDVLPKMCICQNAESKEINAIQIFASAMTTYSLKRLNVDSSEISGGLDDSTKIKIGDLVRRSPR